VNNVELPNEQNVRVFLLYHVSHVGRIEPVSHRDAEGNLLIDPEAGDDVKLLGCYSSDGKAQSRIDRARGLPGFREEPDCFFVDRYVVDRDEWASGFETLGWEDARS
jgi:hypothetical protein